MKEYHPSVKVLEYNYIDHGIYIGTNLCCQIHFDESLKDQGIEADISLEATQVDRPFGVNFYTWLPVEENQAPTIEQLDFGISAIEKLIAMHKKMYVHCQNGHSRAPTLVAAYFIKHGKTFDEAVAFIKKRRPTIHLHESQILALENFQKIISEKAKR